MASDWEYPFSQAATSVLAQPGGASLVLESLARLPHATWVNVKSGWFSKTTYLALGDRRFRASHDGRLEGQHVVGDVVVSSGTFAAGDAGAVLTSAVRSYLQHFGGQLEGEIVAVTAGLQAAIR